VTAGAHGADMDQVPTVDATFAIDGSTKATNHQNNSAAALSTPCQPDCGVSNSLFQTTRRPKNFSTLTSSQRKHEPRLVGVAVNSGVHVSISSGFARQSKSRGPPALV